MQRVILALFLTIATSLFFFPFEFSFLPGFNTKMIMAGFGLGMFGINMARGMNKACLDKDISFLSLIAVLVSIAGILSVTLNNTYDFSYATYIISMWVWLGGAYFVIGLMKMVHGSVSIPLLANYLIAVCVGQCLVAFAMSEFAPLKNFVDSFLGSTGFMGKVEDRLYGIGASLDVGGMRFAAILALIAYLCTRRSVRNTLFVTIAYVVAFCIISVIGNMIGRSTVIGMVVAIIYVMLIVLSKKTEYLSLNLKKLGKVFLVVSMFFVVVLVYYYHTSSNIHDNLRFAFEGFFSLVEKGRWETHSNEILKNMYVFPDNIHTWLVGDGYMENPYDMDPYYIGPKWRGFYMGTDVGYLRFIFYFGLIGTLLFVYYMYRVAIALMYKHPHHKALFLLVLLINYIMWFKVASDLFPVFALFLCLDSEAGVEEKKMELASV